MIDGWRQEDRQRERARAERPLNGQRQRQGVEKVVTAGN